MEDPNLGDYRAYDCNRDLNLAVDYHQEGVIVYTFDREGVAKDSVILTLPAIAYLLQGLHAHGYMEETQ